MRSLTFLLATTLLATTALAQGVTTAPVDSTTLPQQPFNTATPPAAAPVGSSGLGKVFDEADVNHDNVVTKAEFMAMAERHFGMADTNKDGKITREEMQAQQNVIMQQMQKNLLGNNWQNKLNQFMGTPAPAPSSIGPVAPTPPSAPVVPGAH